MAAGKGNPRERVATGKNREKTKVEGKLRVGDGKRSSAEQREDSRVGGLGIWKETKQEKESICWRLRKKRAAGRVKREETRGERLSAKKD